MPIGFKYQQHHAARPDWAIEENQVGKAVVPKGAARS